MINDIPPYYSSDPHESIGNLGTNKSVRKKTRWIKTRMGENYRFQKTLTDQNLLELRPQEKKHLYCGKCVPKPKEDTKTPQNCKEKPAYETKKLRTEHSFGGA